MRLICDLFFIVFSILYLPYFLIKGKWRDFSVQRLGVYAPDIALQLKGRRPVWVHAVSVGEVIAAAPLLEEIRRNYPSETLVVSTVTSTGFSVASRRFGSFSTVIYFPLDLSFIVERAIRTVNPKAVLIAETEVWPNFITSLKRHGAKIILFNGRISKSSFKGYKLAAFLLRRILGSIEAFLMQSRSDADKIISLGAPGERVVVTGNLKYDAAFLNRAESGSGADELRQRFGLDAQARLIIAGSTHPGEEAAVMRCYKRLIGEYPQLRLLVAPRHVDRANQVAALAREYGLNPILTSAAGGLRGESAAGDVLILDVIGVLSGVYSIGEVIFVGGSLVRKGGQNPLEAANHSKAIIFGPHTHNFEEITDELIRNAAAVRVRDERELLDSIRRLLNDGDERRRLGEKAKAILDSNAGVAKKDAELISSLIFSRT